MKIIWIGLALLLAVHAKAQTALCYSEQRHAERGFLGIIDRGLPLYYEAWNVENNDGTRYSAIVLRTDTTAIPDSIDFCLDVTHRSDTVFVLIDRGDSPVQYASTKPFTVPTLLQVLMVTHGSQRLELLNHDDSQNTITLKDDTLTLAYLTTPASGHTITETFVLTDGVFRSAALVQSEK